MNFPQDHWVRIYSTNLLERVIREVRRRINVVGVFPDEPSLIRLVGALLVEMSDEWEIERRYFPGPARTGSLETMHKLTEPEQALAAEPIPLRLAPIR